MKIITGVSHLDHNLTVGQLDFIKKKFEGRGAFFKETVELPEELGTVECNLVGPATGLPAVSEEEVVYQIRGTRKCASRILRRDMTHDDESNTTSFETRPKPQVRTVTVIAGPYEQKCLHCDGKGGGAQATLPHLWHCYSCEGTGTIKHECVLYTAYGGPCAPREPGDPSIASWDELQESRKFWAEHALIE